jgi:hypothetical protein
LSNIEAEVYRSMRDHRGMTETHTLSLSSYLPQFFSLFFHRQVPSCCNHSCSFFLNFCLKTNNNCLKVFFVTESRVANKQSSVKKSYFRQKSVLLIILKCMTESKNLLNEFLELCDLTSFAVLVHT